MQGGTSRFLRGGRPRPGRSAWVLAGALSLAACDLPAATPAKGPENAAPVATAPTAPMRERAPDPVLLDAIPADATIVARLDLEAARRDDVWRGAFVGFPLAEPLLKWGRACGLDLVESAAEATAAWTSARSPFVALRLTITDEDATRCALTLAGGPAAAETVAGQSAVRLGPDLLFLAQKGHALIGARAQVEAAAARIASPSPERAPLVSKLPVGPAMILSAAVHETASDLALDGTFALADRKLAIDADIGAPSEQEALLLVERIKVILVKTSVGLESELAAGGEDAQIASDAFKRLLDGVVVKANGDHVRAQATFEGEPLQVVSAFGSLTAVAFFGARRYLANAKTMEAKSAAGAIMKALIAKVRADLDAEKAKKGGDPTRVKFPSSAPLTPPTVPAAAKFVPADDTWSHPTWRSLGFRMVDPLYYAYEIEVSKDGKTAIVRARGDLDGDGKQSRFELRLELTKAGGLMVPTQMLIEDEYE